jgi:hypothetical protein
MDNILKWVTSVSLVVIAVIAIASFVGGKGGSVMGAAIASNNSHLGGSPTAFGNTYFGDNVEVDGTLYLDGETSAARMIPGGASAAITGLTTSTLAATVFCDNSYATLSSVTTTPTLTLPAYTALFADCLTVDGQYIETVVAPITTSTIFAAGSGGTLLNSSSNTVAAGKMAVIRIIRNSATTYKALIINLVN